MQLFRFCVHNCNAVSYTHLDVYKRQVLYLHIFYPVSFSLNTFSIVLLSSSNFLFHVCLLNLICVLSTISFNTFTPFHFSTPSKYYKSPLTFTNMFSNLSILVSSLSPLFTHVLNIFFLCFNSSSPLPSSFL